MNNTRTVKHRLVIVVLVAAAVVGCASTPRSTAAAATSPSPTPTASPRPMFLGTRYPSQGHTHLTPGEPDDFVYNSDPPTSGPHRELFIDAFVSRTSIPSYVQVHLLEHGNVLLQYHCKCPDIAAALGQIAMQFDKPLVRAGEQEPTPAEVQNAEDQGKAVIVAPYPHMKSKIALTAWVHVATLSSVDKQKIESFINAHLGNPSD